MPTNILDPVKHERLLLDMEHVRETAQIPVDYINRSMVNFCEQAETDWVRAYKTHKANGVAGVVMLGQKNAETRMMGMCGAFIRNFIDARVIPLNRLMAMQAHGTVPSPTVLFIPNLFLDSFGKSLSAWQVQVVYDLLLGRFTSGKTTVVYVESLDGFRNLYGQVAVDHLIQNYSIIGG